MSKTPRLFLSLDGAMDLKLKGSIESAPPG
jgi:hypothetical protein